MKKIYSEFKEFAVKGNMIDIAIGVIIGSAFNKVIDVMVKDIIMPPLSVLTGALDFQELKWVIKGVSLNETSIESREVAIYYGKLISVFLDFLIIAFTVFLVVKVMNRLRKKSQDTKDNSVATPKDIELLSDLKTLLEKQNEILSNNK